ncbi:formin homology 2 domain-containing protein [Dunaliella salina]|uniref:Formin-like protein n=1 Tax=Dunaliella salina TaxID=3046 RepID=A0ABQ7GB25_DUNSA|nr:formin homology 2 domain-containing protein [Dunaliella salina]|eukprot:KAF5831806.1 formin homology 2 domain-containing protein [Dunaliella salina]
MPTARANSGTTSSPAAKPPLPTNPPKATPATPPSGLAAGGSAGYAAGRGGANTTPDGSAPRPSKPMVKLFWPKMNRNQVKDTVWSKVTPNSLLNDSDFLSLEEEFGMADGMLAGGKAGMAGGTAGGAGGAGAGPKRCTKPILLGSMQRGQNVKAAIQQLMCEGTCALDEDKLEQLEKLLPTKEECKLLSAYKGPLSELHDGEAFLVEMTSMPYLGQTLQAIKLMRSFDPRPHAEHAVSTFFDMQGLMQNIGTLVAACSEVTESKLLLLILKIALEAGNFLNSGATQGLAMGFQLDYLLKLKDVRSTKDKGVTLIHFMARAVKGMMPEDCNLKEQLQHCKDAARVDFKAHKKEVSDLKAALRTLQAEVLQPEKQGDDVVHGGSSSSSSSRAEATFKARTSKFIQDATTQIDDAQLALGDVETSLREMGRYLNGPTNRLEHTQLFETLYVFAEDLSKALQQNEERAAQELLRLSCQGGLPRAPPPSSSAQHHAHPQPHHQHHQYQQEPKQPEPVTPCPREKPSSVVPAVSTIKEEPTPPYRGSVTPYGCTSEAGTPQATPPPPPKPTPPSSLLGTRTHMLTQRQTPHTSSPYAGPAYTPTQSRPRAPSVTSSGSSSSSRGFGRASLGTDTEEASLPPHVAAPTSSTTTATQQQQQQQLRRPQALHPPSSAVSSPNVQPSVPRGGASMGAKTAPTHHMPASKPAWVARHARNTDGGADDDDGASSSSSSGYGGERLGVVVRRGRLGARLGSGVVGAASLRASMTARVRRSMHGIGGAAAGVAAAAGAASRGGGTRGRGASGLVGTSTARAGARGGPWGGGNARARAASGSGNGGIGGGRAVAHGGAVAAARGPKGGGVSGAGAGTVNVSPGSRIAHLSTSGGVAKASPAATTPRMTALSAHKKPAPPAWARTSENLCEASGGGSSIGSGKAGGSAEAKGLGGPAAATAGRGSRSDEAEGDARPLAAWVAATPGGASGGVRARRVSGVGKPAPALRPAAAIAALQSNNTPPQPTPPSAFVQGGCVHEHGALGTGGQAASSGGPASAALGSATTPPPGVEPMQPMQQGSGIGAKRGFLTSASPLPGLHVRTTRSGEAAADAGARGAVASRSSGGGSHLNEASSAEGAEGSFKLSKVQHAEGSTHVQGQEGAEASTPHCGVSASPTHFSKLRGSRGRCSHGDSDSEREDLGRAGVEGMVVGGSSSRSSRSVYEEISPAGCSSPPYSPAEPPQDNLDRDPPMALDQHRPPKVQDHHPQQQHTPMQQPGRCTAAAAAAARASAVAQSQCLQSALATEAAAVAAARSQQVQRAMHAREATAAAAAQQQQQHSQDQRCIAEPALTSLPACPVKDNTLSSSVQRHSSSSSSSSSFTNGMVVAGSLRHTSTPIASLTTPAAAPAAAVPEVHAPAFPQALPHSQAELRAPQAAPDMHQQQHHQQSALPSRESTMQSTLPAAQQPPQPPEPMAAVCDTKQPPQPPETITAMCDTEQPPPPPVPRAPCVAKQPRTPPRPGPRLMQAALARSTSYASAGSLRGSATAIHPSAQCVGQAGKERAGRSASSPVCAPDRAPKEYPSLARVGGQDEGVNGVAEGATRAGSMVGIGGDGEGDTAEGVAHTPAAVAVPPAGEGGEGLEHRQAATAVLPANDEDKGMEGVTADVALPPSPCEEMQSPEVPQASTALPSPIQHQNSQGLCLPSPSVGVSQMEWSDRSGLEKQVGLGSVGPLQANLRRRAGMDPLPQQPPQSPPMLAWTSQAHATLAHGLRDPAPQPQQTPQPPPQAPRPTPHHPSPLLRAPLPPSTRQASADRRHPPVGQGQGAHVHAHGQPGHAADSPAIRRPRSAAQEPCPHPQQLHDHSLLSLHASSARHHAPYDAALSQQEQQQQHHHQNFRLTPAAAAPKSHPATAAATPNSQPMATPPSPPPPCPPQVSPQTPEPARHSAGPTTAHTPPATAGGAKPVLSRTSRGGRGVGSAGGAWCTAGQQQQQQQQQQVTAGPAQRRRSSGGAAAHNNSNASRGNNSSAHGMGTPSPQSGGTEGKEQKQMRTAAWLGL